MISDNTTPGRGLPGWAVDGCEGSEEWEHPIDGQRLEDAWRPEEGGHRR